MDQITRVMIISMITNIFLSIIKIIAGIIGNSSALVADGMHSFSDLSTDLVAIIGNFLSKKPADEKHPYGHGKIEYITSIVISFVILTLGISIIYGAFKKEIVIPSIVVAIISFITVLAKLILSRYMIRKGKEYKNNILLASGYESSTDVISSIVVFVSVLMMQLAHIISIFKYADMIATILVGLFILKIGFDILKENMSTILEEQETDIEYLNSLKELILEKNDIRNIDHLMVLKYGSYYKLIAEVSVNPKVSIMEAHRYIHEAENRLRKFDSKIAYVTIHVNPAYSYQLIKAQKKDFKQITDHYKKLIMNDTSENEKSDIDEYTKNTVKQHLSDFYLIVVGEKKVGSTCYYEIDNNKILLDELFIEEEYQHGQIGTSIIKNLKNENLPKTITLWVYKNNTSAILLYEHLGFVKKEETKERIRMEW